MDQRYTGLATNVNELYFCSIIDIDYLYNINRPAAEKEAKM